MPATILTDLQGFVSKTEHAVALVAARLDSPQAQRRAHRARAQLRGAILELGAAIVLEQDHAAAAPSNDAPLTVEVISPFAEGADDERVRTIPADVRWLSPREAALRLGVANDAAGGRRVGEVMGRNGWRLLGIFDPLWCRVDATIWPEQPR